MKLELIDKYPCEKGTSFDDYISILCKHKVLDGDDISWQDIADLASYWFPVGYSRHFYSRHAEEFLSLSSEEGKSEDDELTQEEIEDPTDTFKEQLLELQKERVKIQDERSQNRAYVRRLAREDTIKEIALEAVRAMSAKKEFEVRPPEHSWDTDKEAVLLLSDWHYGMEVDSYWNRFTPEIAKSRVNKLLNETIARCEAQMIDTIHVLNLGDLIAGRIHLPLRIESRIDTITQIMQVSELLAEFLCELQGHIQFVHYYSCTDNHSRIEPDKTQSIDLESLCRITDWYLKMRLKDTGVIIHDNKYGEDIITLSVAGHDMIAVHGDKDKPADAISKLSNFTRHSYEAVLMSHRHHFSADEECGTLVIGNGTLMGTDGYAKSLRLHSEPSQTLIFTTTDRVADSIVRIVLP